MNLGAPTARDRRVLRLTDLSNERRPFKMLHGDVQAMRGLSATVGAAFVMLAMTPQTAYSALICKSGHLYYGGSEFHANRSEAEASAINAWRRVKATTEGVARAARMFPHKDQLHCERATTKEGWRCFVRGGPCHQT
jgi:hypothetical protein